MVRMTYRNRHVDLERSENAANRHLHGTSFQEAKKFLRIRCRPPGLTGNTADTSNATTRLD